MKRFFYAVGSLVRTTTTAIVALAMIAGGLAVANYAVTQGSGTNFGSIVVSSVHYAQQFICDYVTPSQCVNVSSGGAMSVADAGVGGTSDSAATAGGTGSVSAKQRLLTSVVGTANSPTTNMYTVQNVGGEYPTSAVVSQDSDTGTTASTASSLPAVSSYTQYVCGISIRANATAAATGNATLSDGTWTLNFTQWTAPLASGMGEVNVSFSPCKPASAANTAITLTSAAPGSGGVISTGIWGYRVP